MMPWHLYELTSIFLISLTVANARNLYAHLITLPAYMYMYFTIAWMMDTGNDWWNGGESNKPSISRHLTTTAMLPPVWKLHWLFNSPPVFFFGGGGRMHHLSCMNNWAFHKIQRSHFSNLINMNTIILLIYDFLQILCTKDKSIRFRWILTKLKK